MATRHKPGLERLPLPEVRPSSISEAPLTREHVRRPQAPQSPIDDPPTPLQAGQEGCLIL